MNLLAVFRLLIVLSLCYPYINPAIAQTGALCGNDLLKLYRINIPHVKLIKGETPTGNSQNMCTSLYKISGKYAQTTQTFLSKRYGMGKLIFTCCGWAPENGRVGYFRRSHPMASGAWASYSITMHSDETLEKQWDKIDSFYITVAIDAVKSIMPNPSVEGSRRKQ